MHEHLEAERPPTPKELQKYRKGMCEEALRFINGLKKSDAKEVRKAAMMLESNILAEMHAIMDGPRSRKRNREQMEMTLEIAMKCFSKTGTWMHVGLIGAACAAKGLGCQFWTLNEEGKAVLLEDPVLTAVDQAMWNGKQAPKSIEHTVNVISVSAGGRVTRGNDINSIIEWKPKTAGAKYDRSGIDDAMSCTGLEAKTRAESPAHPMTTTQTSTSSTSIMGSKKTGKC